MSESRIFADYTDFADYASAERYVTLEINLGIRSQNSVDICAFCMLLLPSRNPYCGGGKVVRQQLKVFITYSHKNTEKKRRIDNTSCPSEA